MEFGKKGLVVATMLTWLVIIILFMFLAGSFDVEVFFVLWLIGLLIIAELADTRYIRPGYIRSLMMIAGAGTMLFGCIVIRKIWVILYG